MTMIAMIHHIQYMCSKRNETVMKMFHSQYIPPTPVVSIININTKSFAHHTHDTTFAPALRQTASSSRLPRRMAMHALQQNTTNIDAASRRRQAPAEGGVSSSGRCVAPDRIREVLARKQQRWDQQLASTQRKKKPVVPQVQCCHYSCCYGF